MWAGIGRALLYGLSALGVADLFGIGDDDNSGSSLWGNPIVIIVLLILLLYLMNNLSKLKLT